MVRVAGCKGQLFQFNGALYEQTDGVAMGSQLGPLLADVFKSSIEEILEREGKLPSFYRRYVDDTLTVMADVASATDFLDTLNNAHSSVKFTMEIELAMDAPLARHPVTQPIPSGRNKGVCKTYEYRATLTLPESCGQSLQTRLIDNYA